MAVEYTCLDCGHRFPWSSTDRPEALCPRCGSSDLESNPWLLGHDHADGLADEDHFFSGLSV